MDLHSQVPIIQCSYKLNMLLHKMAAEFPVNFRHTVGRQIAERSAHCFSEIVLTNFIRQHQQRLEAFDEIDRTLFLLSMDIRLAKDLKLISQRKHAKVHEDLIAIKKQLLGWKRWSKNQLDAR